MRRFDISSFSCAYLTSAARLSSVRVFRSARQSLDVMSRPLRMRPQRRHDSASPADGLPLGVGHSKLFLKPLAVVMYALVDVIRIAPQLSAIGGGKHRVVESRTDSGELRLPVVHVLPDLADQPVPVGQIAIHLS